MQKAVKNIPETKHTVFVWILLDFSAVDLLAKSPLRSQPQWLVYLVKQKFINKLQYKAAVDCINVMLLMCYKLVNASFLHQSPFWLFIFTLFPALLFT